VSLQDEADRFFAGFAGSDLGSPLAPYPLDVVLVSGDETAIVRLRDGRPAAHGEPDPFWAVELRADHDAFASLWSGELSLGELFYAGRVNAPEEKAKHNLVVALSWSVRRLQDRRAGRRGLPVSRS
jgi:hypothetical protein